TIIRKFKRAVTDSGSEVRFSPDKPGVSNLITIYSVISGLSVQKVEKEFEGKGYGDFKLAVGEVVSDALEPIRKKKSELIADKAYLDEIMIAGAAKANYTAGKTLAKVYRKVGLYSPERKK
ncbi:MAG: tryptophan--tRNA ligase, partial [Clostridia bacterium]|nr:tryptophan--tRNA ligase [Clostridia bacterium]